MAVILNFFWISRDFYKDKQTQSQILNPYINCMTIFTQTDVKDKQMALIKHSRIKKLH